MAVVKSFYQWNGSNVNEFIGFENYISAFQDPMFTTSLYHSFLIAIAYIIIVLTVPLLAAELLYSIRSSRKQYIIRTAFTFPMVVPMVVVILLWKWILAGDNGILNALLSAIGLEEYARPWLSDSSTALGAIIAVGFPWLGSAMLGGLQFLLYYGALQNISTEMIEAAELDGANRFHKFIKIDLPMLASQMKLAVTMAIIQAIQIFENVRILTNGGPGSASITPSLLLYEQGFTYRKMGYASAIGIIMFAIIMILTIFNQKFMKSTESMD